MRLLKPFFRIFGITLALALVLLCIGMIVYDQEDYKSLTAWAVSRYTGLSVTIQGDFAVDFSLSPAIEARDIRIAQKKTGATTADIGYLKLRVAIFPSFFSVFLIEQLVVRDTAISHAYDGAPSATRPLPAREGLPADFNLPIVASSEFRNITLTATNMKTRRATVMRLTRLTLDDVDNAGPLMVRGSGSVNSYGFQIHGRLGALADLSLPGVPFPMDIGVKIADAELRVTGTLADVIHGKGMDLRITQQVVELAKVFQSFGKNVPALGRQSLQARITGHILAPHVSDLRIHLSHGEEIDLVLRGSVANLWTGKGADIAFSGECRREDLVAYLVPGLPVEVTELAFKGTIREAGGALVVVAREAAIHTRDDLKISAAGMWELAGWGTFLPPVKLNLSVSLTAPGTGAITPYLFDFIPESGPCVAKATLLGAGETWAVEDLMVTAGDADTVSLVVRGRIGRIPLAGGAVSEIDITAAIASPNSTPVLTAFHLPLPELGELKITGRVHGSSREVRIDELAASAQDATGLRTAVSGDLAFLDHGADGWLGYVNLVTGISAPDSDALASLMELKPAFSLAPVNAKATLTGTTRVLKLENLVADAGHQGTVSLDLRGRVGAMSFREKTRFRDLDLLVSLHAGKTTDVSALLGYAVPDFGRIRATGRITGRTDAVKMEDIAIAIDGESGFRLAARGTADSLLVRKDTPVNGVTATVTASGSSLRQLLSGVAPGLPDWGAFQSNARIAYQNGTVIVKDLQFAAGGEDTGSFSLKGNGEAFRRQGLAVINASAKTVSKAVAHGYLGKSIRKFLPVDVEVQLTAGPEGIELDKLTATVPDGPGMRVRADGKILKAGQSYTADIAVASEAVDISVVTALLDFPLPRLAAPVSVRGRVLRRTGDLSFNGKAGVGNSIINTSVAYLSNRGYPFFSIDIDTRSIALADLAEAPPGEREGPAPATTGGNPASAPPFSFRKLLPVEKLKDFKIPFARTGSPATALFFPETPLFLERLTDVDLSLDFRADAIIGPNFRFRDARMALTLDKGKLRIHPATLTHTQGAISLDATIDAGLDTPHISVKVTGEDIDLGRLLSQFRSPIVSDGLLTCVLDLKAEGHTPRQLASTLAGELAVAVENGRVKRSLDLLAPDVLDMVSRIRASTDYIDLNCFMARFLFAEGRGKSQILWSDTATTRTKGAGTIDLGKETIDLVLKPERKKKKIGMATPARIRGPLRNPRITKIPAIEALNLYGEIFMPYVFLPARGLGYMWYLLDKGGNEQTPCFIGAPE